CRAAETAKRIQPHFDPPTALCDPLPDPPAMGARSVALLRTRPVRLAVYSALAPAGHRAASGVQPNQAAPFQGASCRRSVTVVAVRGIAISVIARIETTVSAVKAAPESAVKAAPNPAAMKAAPESTAAKTAGLGSPSADRGSKRESNDRSRQQQLAGHETLLLTFLIRFHHRIAVMCAGNRPRCLFKTD